MQKLFIITDRLIPVNINLQGRNPKPNLFSQIKAFKLQSFYLDYFINKQLNYYRLVTVLSADIGTDTIYKYHKTPVIIITNQINKQQNPIIN